MIIWKHILHPPRVGQQMNKPNLISRSFLNVSNEFAYPSGMSASSGASLSNQFFHCFSLRAIWKSQISNSDKEMYRYSFEKLTTGNKTRTNAENSFTEETLKKNLSRKSLVFVTNRGFTIFRVSSEQVSI